MDASEILQTNHYYPFGMQHEPVGTITGAENAYQYNGKELNSDFGLDWLDYGARWYDASIGRWSAVDPLSEKYYSISPYVYVANNPLKFIDPDGRTQVIGQNGEILWDDGKNDGNIYRYSGDQELNKNMSFEDISTATGENGLKQLTEGILLPGTKNMYGAKWVASGEELVEYITPQAEMVGITLDEKQIELREDKKGKNAGLSVKAKNKKGKKILKTDKHMLYIDYRGGGTARDAELNYYLGNVYDLQNSLAQEKQHLDDYNGFLEEGKNEIIDNGSLNIDMEIRGIKAQKSHSTWSKTTRIHQLKVKRYDVAFKVKRQRLISTGQYNKKQVQ